MGPGKEQLRQATQPKSFPKSFVFPTRESRVCMGLFLGLHSPAASKRLCSSPTHKASKGIQQDVNLRNCLSSP